MNRRIVLLCSILLLSACHQIRGNGNKAEETRTVNSFTQIQTNGDFTLSLTVTAKKAEQVELHLSGDENLLPLVTSEVSSDRLILDTTKAVWTKLPLTLTAAVEDVQVIEVNGAGDIRLDGLDNEALAVRVNGSGSARLSGKTGKLELEINGSGDMDATDLQADSVNIDISGSGDCKVHAVNELKVDIAGSGDVTYLGDPDSVSQDIAGSGSVSKAK